jgi:hypothetical protein
MPIYILENNEVRSLSRQRTKEAIERLTFWMRSDNARASVAAANALLDRGWGKPAEPVATSSTEPVVVALNYSGRKPSGDGRSRDVLLKAL